MHFRIIFAILGFAIAGLLLLGSLWIYQSNLRAERLALAEIAALEEVDSEKPDPGLSYFRRATDMIAAGNTFEGRDVLLDLVRIYKDSAKYDESKRIIGEINMDSLLSRTLSPGKKEYIVQRGDSLNLIASRNKTSLDFIQRANGMFTNTIHPGEKLVVFPLTDFSLVVDTENQLLTLKRKGRFFKEYPVSQISYPPGMRAPFKTKVTNKTAWDGKKKLRSTDFGYSHANRWITLQRSGFMLLPNGVKGQPPAGTIDPVKALEEDYVYGVFLLAEDIHEISAVVTTSTPVSIL